MNYKYIHMSGPKDGMISDEIAPQYEDVTHWVFNGVTNIHNLKRIVCFVGDNPKVNPHHYNINIADRLLEAYVDYSERNEAGK